MNMSRNSHPLDQRTRQIHSSRRRGLGLPEMLISLAIAAMLLTATAFALDSSCFAYKVNQEQASLIQTDRLTLNRITTMIRRTNAHQPHTTATALSFAAGNIVTDNGIDMIDSSNVPLTFTYDSSNQRLLAISGGVTHVLANGVTSFVVTMEPMRSPESIRTGGAWDLLKRATFLISVHTNSKTAQGSETTNQQTITLSASVMPRQNTWQ
jgi:prepilin-type N-terminal cleavage/methylation domain-containing protein